jgi:hypothetical protein
MTATSTTSRFSEGPSQVSHGIVPHPRILTNDVKNMHVHVFYVVPRDRRHPLVNRLSAIG